MGRGYRNMYYATGQPGWMRLGYSPGWAGRSRTGLGPCAEYLTTGRWPAGVTPVAWTGPAGSAAAGGVSSELEMLRARAEQLEANLDSLRKRISELEKGSEG
jgi:hypothetical protein